MLLILSSVLLQAIASMVRARDADPSNLDVLLALGVSHTNGMHAMPSELSILYSRVVDQTPSYASTNFDLIWWIVYRVGAGGSFAVFERMVTEPS